MWSLVLYAVTRQSSCGSCLSDEVKYGTAPIFRPGGILGIVSSGRREVLPIRKHSGVWLYLFITCMWKALVKYCTLFLYLVKAGDGITANRVVGPEDPCGLQTSHRLPRKSLSSYFALWKRVEPPVTFLTAALLCTLLQHMGRLGGRRRALPLRLQGIVEETITPQTPNLKAITCTN